jgi:hypothetical protein
MTMSNSLNDWLIYIYAILNTDGSAGHPDEAYTRTLLQGKTPHSQRRYKQPRTLIERTT